MLSRLALAQVRRSVTAPLVAGRSPGLVVDIGRSALGRPAAASAASPRCITSLVAMTETATQIAQLQAADATALAQVSWLDNVPLSFQLAAVWGVLFAAAWARIKRTDRINAMKTETHTKIDKLGAKIDTKFDALDTKMNALITAITKQNGEHKTSHAKLHGRIKVLGARIDAQDKFIGLSTRIKRSAGRR